MKHHAERKMNPSERQREWEKSDKTEEIDKIEAVGKTGE